MRSIRGQGVKNPKGETKSLIVLYIAKKGRAHTDDISDYLGEKGKNRGIKTKNLIYKHLNELEAKKVLIRKVYGHNKPDSFRINKNFNTFRVVCQSLKKYDHLKDFMTTKFYISYIESDEFLEKLYLNLLKETFVKLYMFVKDTKNVESLKEKMDEQEYQKLLRWAENLKTANQDIEPRFQKLYQLISQHDIDTLYTMAEEHTAILNKQITQGEDFLIDEMYLLSYLCKFMVLPPQKVIIADILRYSPSGIDFILNYTKTNPFIIAGILIKHLEKELLRDHNIIQRATKIEDIVVDNKIKGKEYRDAFVSMDKSTRNELLTIPYENPLVFILRSLLISDIVAGNIVGNIRERDLEIFFSPIYSEVIKYEPITNKRIRHKHYRR